MRSLHHIRAASAELHAASQKLPMNAVLTANELLRLLDTIERLLDMIERRLEDLERDHAQP